MRENYFKLQVQRLPEVGFLCVRLQAKLLRVMWFHNLALLIAQAVLLQPPLLNLKRKTSEEDKRVIEGQMFDKMTTPGKPEISEDNENDDVSEEEETESGGDENAQEIAKDPTSRHPIQVSSGEDCIVLKFDHEIVCVQPVQICAVDESSCMNGNDLSHEHKVVEKMSQTNSSPMVVHRRGADGAVGVIPQ
ncbi:hypothetical protein U1Q18_032852 [Sarracenia purpurea var. burkii]